MIVLRRLRDLWIPLAAVAVILVSSRAAAVADEPQDVPELPQAPLFETHVRPILQAHCHRCHGENTRKADLNLMSSVGIRTGGESGESLLTEDPAESPLVVLIEEGAMPPDEGSRPNAAELAMIRQWIQSGASFADADPASDGHSTLTDQAVIPVMLRRCVMCHGAARQESDLDLRTAAAMQRGGSSGPALVAGKPDASPLLARVRSEACPPEAAIGQAGIEPMTGEEQQLVARWIQAGAIVEAPPEDEVALGQDPLVTEQDRQFWSFQRPVKVAPPPVADTHRVRTPVDAFLLARLEEQDLTFSPAAERLTLLRRVAFDLTGLPPEPAEIEAYLHDTSPGAYARMVDRFLASPRYGERWGRFWLDLAGYADSEGKRNADMIRPYAWRYRDYVIRSFNENLPFDQFLLEQLAGDELVDYRRPAEVDPDAIEKLVATGFLRMAPDGTSANPVNRFSDRIEVISDELDVVGRGLLGLTLNCARCHSHKYDPLPQRDYYRMVAVFQGAYDEYDWLTPQPFSNQWSQAQQRHLTVLTAAEQQELAEHNGPIEKQLKQLRAESKDVKQQLKKLSDDGSQPNRDADSVQDPGAKKGKTAQDKAAQDDRQSPTKAELEKQQKQLEKRVKELEGELREPPRIRALWDRGHPSPTFVYRRGDETQPAQQVHPGVPSVLTSASLPYEVQQPAHDSPKTGRRLALARWLTHPENPLTARVFVNRVWHRHFGRGIVRSLDNFGKLGTPPTHPELLDWLAVEFMESGWDVKHLHRRMLLSSAYRQSSVVEPHHLELDPHNDLVSRMPMVRLDAEAVRDSMLFAAGQLVERRFGEPDPVDVRKDGLVTSKPVEGGRRRSVYVRQRRKEMPTLLETFDLPQMNPNCTRRPSSTVVSQPLALLNNGLVYSLANDFADRVAREAGPELPRQVELAYRFAVGRSPRADEHATALETLRTLAEQWSQIPADQLQRATPQHRALIDYCHLLFNSAAFLYVD